MNMNMKHVGGILPRVRGIYIRSIVCCVYLLVYSCVLLLCLWISLWIATLFNVVLAVWVFSESGLSTSLPWCVRPSSIKPIFYWHPIDPCGSVWPLFGVFFGLRCFQPLQLSAWLPSSPCQTTGRLAAPLPCSSRTKSNFPSGHWHP